MGASVISKISENDDSALKCSVQGARKKFLELMVLHCNSRTYRNAYLITFKVRPFKGTHTLAHSILPLLEAPMEGFFWNLPEFGRRIRIDVLHGSDTGSHEVEAHFQPNINSEIRVVLGCSLY